MQNTKTNYLRHGDVTLERTDEILEGFKAKKVPHLVVALGEVTGHSHKVLPIGDAEVLVLEKEGHSVHPDDNDIPFMVQGGNAMIIHEEHEPIILEPGIYNRKMKVQFNPFKNAIENVRD